MELNNEIEVEISDYLLTPLSCSSLINEILKCLIYQKCQIPYPYNWLKNKISRRRILEKEAENDPSDLRNKSNLNFTVENHFRIASRLYDHLEEAMSELSIVLGKGTASEILIVFGPTPICPKEVCTIHLPALAHGHSEAVHIKDAQRHQHKALRQVFLSDTWMTAVDSSIPCTNTYIFIKKDDSEHPNVKHFVPCKPLTFQKNVKQYSITLNCNSGKDYLCCNDLEVFSETGEPKDKRTKIDESSKLHSVSHSWYQFAHSIQGFKNCYINKTATCDLW